MGDELICAAFAEIRERSKQKRADNRKKSKALLECKGYKFAIRNSGAHLVINHRGITVDFWPGTGLWKARGEKEGHRGVGKLCDYLDKLPES